MRTYLLLKERAESFRADPEVAEALAASRVPELAIPTLEAGEGWEQLLSSAGSEAFDPEAAAAKGMHYERLDQLALEHVLGAR
jgi:xylose isomerase